MKYCLFFLILITSLNIYTQTDTNIIDNQKSKIYIYRAPSSMIHKSGFAMKIYHNKKFINRLKNNSYFLYETEMGVQEFICTINNQKYSIKIDAEGGKSYYIRCSLEPKTNIFELKDTIDAYYYIYETDMQNLDDSIKFKENRFTKIGLIVGLGKGISSFNARSDRDDEKLMISMGDGLSLGLLMEKEFKKTSICGYIGYKYNLLALDTTIKVSFSHLYFYGTYNYYLIQDKYIKFKIGFGGDLYLESIYRISYTNELNVKENYKIVYRTDGGLHFSTFAEIPINRKSLIIAGLKINYVRYHFKSGSSNAHFVNNDSKNPFGSGIDYQIGYLFRF